MELAYHFYIIEAILAIILVYLFLLLIDRKDKHIVPQNDSELLSKYKLLQQKHYALHKLSNKIIVEKTTLKSQLNQLNEKYMALETESIDLLCNYNKAIAALDTNTYPSNLKSQE